jgi:hypothetical protein
MEIRKIKLNEVEDYCKLQYRAYPSMRFGSKADFDSFIERVKKSFNTNEFILYGGFEKKLMVGSMTLYNFQINYLGEWLPIEGIGSVAVDLLHKREHICQKMMAWTEQNVIERKIPLAFLFPFRPDFYVPFGYGYGPLLYQYSLDPAFLPHTGDKSKLCFLTQEDIPLIRDFESRMDSRSHGYFKKQDRELYGLFDRVSFQKVGYMRDNRLEGWMAFNTQQPDPKNFLRSHLYIYEWWNETSDSRMAFLSFLYSQKDQYEQIVYNTVDPSLMHMVQDPRSDKQKLVAPFISHPVGQASTSIFYSVIDPGFIFKKLVSYKGKDGCEPFDWEIRRPFPENHIQKVSWPYKIKSTCEKVVISTTQSVASSILMGSLTLEQAVRWNIASITSEKSIKEIDEYLRLPLPFGNPDC